MAWSDDADPWHVEIVKSASRELDALTDSVRHTAVETIAGLEEDPFPPGSILPRGYTNLYRLKFYREAYRIVYVVSEKQRRVIVRRIRPRATAYDGLHDPGR
jgi:mRNA-degrading endonuclease RelE of RelBE toxin-antitoxin system